MKKLTVAMIGIVACCWAILPAVGQSPNLPPKNIAPEGHTVRSEVLFEIGQGRLDPDFKDNKYHLLRFTGELARILADTNYVVSRISVSGSASPDDKLERNLQLAGQRVTSLRSYLVAQCHVPADNIEMINLGENWPALRTMIESSDMPYRDEMLSIMDQNPDDRDARKHKMMYYANSEPWLWMYNNFFPALRTGTGNTHGRASLNALSSGNWERIQQIVRALDMDARTQQALLEVIETETNLLSRLQRFSALCPDEATYSKLQAEMFTGLLCEPSVLSSDNWTLLREKIAASDMPSRAAALHIIDNVPVAAGREQQLKALENGEPYRVVLDRFLPELLVASRATRIENGTGESVGEVPLRDENWNRLRKMIAVSEMPDRDAVLALVDGQTDPVVREQQLRAMKGGDTYKYINEVFFPELLYGLSAAAQENWAQLIEVVGRSDMAHKNEVLEIIRTTSPGLERDQAIRALDGGESWQRMGELMLPELLLATEQVPMTGSGMSFSYELSPAAEERAAGLAQKQMAERQTMQTAALNGETASAQYPQLEQATQTMTTRQRINTFSARLALKTDLMLWGGVMPGFEMGTWTPNLSVELYFAHRWSVQAGFAYANWDALNGNKGLYAVAVGDMEARRWFGKPSRFRGFYLGVYGQYGQYDVQQGAQGNTGSFWCAGLGAGWMQPLSRHWAIEGEIRGGYRSAQNDIYDIEEGHTYLNNKQTDGKFTPQLRVQVVYRFGKAQK